MPHPFTTPTYVAEIKGADLTDCTIVLTLKQGKQEVELTEFDNMEVDGDVTTFEFTLTQEQSGLFNFGLPVEVQANVIDHSGYRVASNIDGTYLDRQLNKRVMEVPNA